MRMMDTCINTADLRLAAKKKLPKMVFDYIDGAADDEVTMARSSSAFDDYQLCPVALQDVSKIDLSTTVMGQKIDMPLMISPTAQARMFHHTGEISLAKAADKFGTFYGLSSLASATIEDISACSSNPKMYQIYVFKDRSVVQNFIKRCQDNDYASMCLTTDVAVLGNRERDIVNGLSFPFRPSFLNALNIFSKPRWLFNHLAKPKVMMENLRDIYKEEKADSLMKIANAQLIKDVSWDDAKWMKDEWGGKFAIKGILRADDAARAAEMGFDAVIVSNHGGRQLDHSPAPIDVLEEIVEAVDGRCEVILDGGIRRGTDVLKALAMGATACMTGRPFLFGLAAAGQAGVERALEIFRTEIERDMILLGRKDIKSIRKSDVRKL